MNKDNQTMLEVRFKRGILRRFLSSIPQGMRFVGCVGFCREIAFYLSRHETSGIRMDTECQTLIYDERITVTLRKERGTWVIIEISVSSPITAYRPRFIWQQLKRGIEILTCRVFAGWQVVRIEMLSLSPA